MFSYIAVHIHRRFRVIIHQSLCLAVLIMNANPVSQTLLISGFLQLGAAMSSCCACAATTPLISAVIMCMQIIIGHIGCVRSLLAARAAVDADVRGGTPLFIASERGHIGVLYIQVGQSRSGTTCTETNVHRYAHGLVVCKGVVKALLAANADVDRSDVNNCTVFGLWIDMQTPMRDRYGQALWAASEQGNKDVRAYACV